MTVQAYHDSIVKVCCKKYISSVNDNKVACIITDLTCLCSGVKGVSWIPGYCVWRGAAQCLGVWQPRGKSCYLVWQSFWDAVEQFSGCQRGKYCWLREGWDGLDAGGLADAVSVENVLNRGLDVCWCTLSSIGACDRRRCNSQTRLLARELVIVFQVRSSSKWMSRNYNYSTYPQNEVVSNRTRLMVLLWCTLLSMVQKISW